MSPHLSTSSLSSIPPAYEAEVSNHSGSDPAREVLTPGPDTPASRTSFFLSYSPSPGPSDATTSQIIYYPSRCVAMPLPTPISVPSAPAGAVGDVYDVSISSSPQSRDIARSMTPSSPHLHYSPVLYSVNEHDAAHFPLPPYEEPGSYARPLRATRSFVPSRIVEDRFLAPSPHRSRSVSSSSASSSNSRSLRSSLPITPHNRVQTPPSSIRSLSCSISRKQLFIIIHPFLI